MNPTRRRRLLLVLLLVVASAVAVTLVALALQRNVAYLYTPAEVLRGIARGIRSTAWAAGSDKPEKEEVRIGFIPMTDCASVVMAFGCGVSSQA